MRQVTLQNISVRFGSVQALSAVDASVGAGEVVMLAGPNGAGKSTLLRVVLGLLDVDTGSMQVDGVPAQPGPAFRRHLGYLPESVAFTESLTGRQVMRFFARVRGVGRAAVEASLSRVGLAAAGRRVIRGYSRGMRQRLGLAVATLGKPALLVLDEPTGGLDQEGLTVLWDVFTEWQTEGRMVLLSSHDLTLLERRVDRICLLSDGHLVADASPESLRMQAALPVRVSFDLGGDPTGFSNALARIGLEARDAQNPGGVTVLVPPDELLQVLDLRGQFNGTVQRVRVEEPGLDAVYERLLSRPLGLTTCRGGA